MNKLLIILSLLIATAGCRDNKKKFSEFVDIEEISNVKMYNNSGEFQLTHKQLEKFKKEVATLTIERGFSAKVGGISMDVTINGVVHTFSTNTHGKYIEIPIDGIEWSYFNTNGINFDNYTPEN